MARSTRSVWTSNGPRGPGDAYGVAKLARGLQPNIMLRNRGINDYGDYETPEGRSPKIPARSNGPGR